MLLDTEAVVMGRSLLPLSEEAVDGSLELELKTTMLDLGLDALDLELAALVVPAATLVSPTPPSTVVAKTATTGVGESTTS